MDINVGSPIYLDNNATLPLNAGVLKKMLEVLGAVGNPSSIHSYGRKVRSYVESARLRLGEILQVSPERLYFTSGGTEGNNTILKTFANKPVFVAATEHDCVFHVCTHGKVIPVHSNGILDLNALEDLISKDAAGGLVSVMLANNETGVIQPIAEIADICHKYGLYLHTDACQALGKIPFYLHELKVDYATFSAHKIGGPMGVGCIYVAEKRPLEPLLLGGGQEKGRRSGLQNPALAVGFVEALDQCSTDAWSDVKVMRDWITDRLTTVHGDVKVIAQNTDRLPNTICLTMPGVSQETQVMAFDLAGISLSAGAACSSGKMDVSRVLLAMGLEPEEASTAIRISLSPANTMDEVTRCVDTWIEIFNRAAPTANVSQG